MANKQISALAESKSTLIAGDYFAIDDSADANTTKNTTAADIKTFTDQAASDFDHDDLSNITGTVGEYNHPTDAQMTAIGTIGDLQADVITTRGDLVIGDASAEAARLAVGTNGQVLTTNGTDVSWGAASGSGGGIGEFNGTESLTITGTNAMGFGIGSNAGDNSVMITPSGGSFNGNADDAIGAGRNLTITGQKGIGFGLGVNVSQESGIGLGEYAKAERKGELTMNNSGDSTAYHKWSLFRYSRDIVGDTATEIQLMSDGARLTIPTTEACFTFHGIANAWNTTDKLGKGFEIKGVIKRVSGTTSLVGSSSVTTIAEDSGMETVSLAITADDTNDALLVTATGLSAKTIFWDINIQASQFYYR